MGVTCHNTSNVALTDKQSGVLRGVIIGGSATVLGVFGSMLVGVDVIPSDASPADKLAFVLKSDLPIAIWLGISVGILARHRFFTPEDIDGGGLSNGTEVAKIFQANLQNTLEQSVLAVLAHSIWIVSLPSESAFTIWVAVVFFVVGRIMFLAGYRKGAPARAVGFALTFYPSMLLLAISLVSVVVGTFR